ncbi:MAG: WecB/TagA/CpsF family glycosyltransferase [Synechococcales cyanobacterium RM1_1_8]|nr:WecB/TagA/CpsF family glycosyltransferase [Synechococcales cyanobacterium RM1_1_8]
MTRLNFLNISIDNFTSVELLQRLAGGGTVYTPNVYHLLRLQQDREFYQVYQNADYCICDSQILWAVSRLLGRPIREKISGSDLFPAFYHYYRDDETVKIFLLGAAEGVGEKARSRINQKLQRNIVVGSYSPPYGFEADPAEGDRILERIQASGATVLAVGLGAPKQEKWIDRNRDRLPNVKVFMAIGATIDFEAGQVARSPRWMSRLGLEWLYRILMEPRRLWKRYVSDALPFMVLVLTERLGFYRDPFRDEPTYLRPNLGGRARS